MTSIARDYLDSLEKTENPQLTLLKFYRELFGLAYDKEDIEFISNLVSLYGKYTVFEAILDIGARRHSLRIYSKPFINGSIRNHCLESFYSEKSKHPSKDMTYFIIEREKLAKEGVVLKEELDE